MQFKIKGGRLVYDKQTKKVKAAKEKGLIHVLHNQEQETHFKWINLETNMEEFDIIVFPGDAVFEAVVGTNNTYVLRFGMDDDRYFFWFQEKCDAAKVVEQINKVINYEEDQNQMKDEASESKPKAEPAPQPEKKSEGQAQPHPQPQFQAAPDFIAKLAQNLAAATKKHHHKQQETALTHLCQVITPQALNLILKQLTPSDQAPLLQHMPPEHKDAQHIPSTLRSPQFQQAMDVLSDALNSENVLPLFMELGLNQEHLHRRYGVQAFLVALVEKFKKKQEEVKDTKEMKDANEMKE